MSDDILIKAILGKNKGRYGAGVVNDGDAFEYFCAETILKPYGLAFDEVEKGIVDGQNDGGIDSAYFFVNRTIVDIDTDMEFFKSPVSVDLIVIQSKMNGGFNETALAKLNTSLPELIDLGADTARLSTLYNNKVCEFFDTYRSGLRSLASEFPSVKIHIIYATLATDSTNTNVQALLPIVKSTVEQKFRNSVCTVELWNAAKLYTEAQKQSLNVRQLPFVKPAISHGAGYVVLTKLKDYFDFIDSDGQISGSLFEFNVRDYQSNAAVNKEIASTLENKSDKADFW